ncbi:MAG: preprotein translocase subunit SecA, partial [Lentisphaerae bacterium]
MIGNIFKAIFGSRNDRILKRYWPIVRRINEKFEEYERTLSDDELRKNTEIFRERLKKGESLDDLLVEAYATVKSACKRLVGEEVVVTGHPRKWDMVPFDVQLLGAIALHHGSIAEMQTGEGKTLVAILPLYLNALTGRNCQLVTVNDYLARRDSEWVGFVLRWLGLTVGCIQNDIPPGSEERKAQYQCDVTYGTCSEFGFDYLRDMGMCTSKEDLVQRDYYYAIVDEIDSILIDEARTPLIIAGPVENSTHQYDLLKPKVERLVRAQLELCNRLASEARPILQNIDDHSDEEIDDAVEKLYLVKLGMPRHKQLMRLMQEPEIRRLLERFDLQVHSEQNRGLFERLKDELYFSIDERAHDADLSARGRKLISDGNEDQFVIPDLASLFSEIDSDEALSIEEKRKKREELQKTADERAEAIHNISQLLKAYCLYERDVHYIIEDGKVVIVDENTGRPMYGRRFSEGLHMALEAKENVTIERETRTLATITIQNYFRMYEKLAGMTGTASTEANEFKEIYNLDVVTIPTNRPCIRKDYNDVLYKTQADKYRAIIEEIKECHQRGQPVLVGTVSVEVSEILSRLLRREKIPHNVLNAKYHQQEAEIVALAGQKGAVTIATNMAGRGTDIVLGEGVAELGGLHVIGTERHDSRRIDRQLRGRCARQGDPGSSRFYVSMEDKLMRIFGGDRITKILERFGFENGQELSGGMLNHTISTAQKRVEQENFAYRKRTLQYDDVMNEQRKIIYGERKEILFQDDVREILFDHVYRAILERINLYLQPEKEFGYPFDRSSLLEWLRKTFTMVPFEDSDLDVVPQEFEPEELASRLVDMIEKVYLDFIKLYEEDDPDFVKYFERQLLLNAIDENWQEHIDAMDQMRQSVRLQGFAQRDPLIEYKKEAFALFQNLVIRIDEQVAESLFKSVSAVAEQRRELEKLFQQEELMHEVLGQFGERDSQAIEIPEGMEVVEGPDGNLYLVQTEQEQAPPPPQEPYRNTGPVIGRNDPCPCGSGKKYKRCC